ncbi:caspase family protein [Oculatella sp. LEGE 06141]|uniref:caspase family protein n=1 Tax=Oculatella sp. LEGE 06141 TaxID=1828648 RepID=UPI001882877A|nr:caspase family protein [Oculatella sp. LEGE 06141]MBE9180701.1 caspase family protein [Oculatella sp. LEGE 06141]
MVNWAIVVGINQYNHLPSDKHLRFAVQDAEAVRQFLCDRSFPTENVLLCTDHSPNLHFSTSPSRTNLRRILREEIQRINRDDSLWFFFAGHGISKHHRDYLLPCDGLPSDEETAIDIRFVVNCLRDSQARNIVLVLDMCRSNRIEPDGRNGIDSDIGRETQAITRELSSDNQRIVTIFACSPGQSSFEIPDLEHGVFTYTLLQGLEQHTIVSQLERYLAQRVPEVNQRYGKPRQTPLINPEPGWTYNLPLLPEYTTRTDVDSLVALAKDAELQRDFALAKNLWWTVIEANPSRERIREARDAIARIEESQRSPSIPSLPPPSPSPSSPSLHLPIRRREFLGAIAVIGVIAIATAIIPPIRCRILGNCPPPPPNFSLDDDYFSRGDNLILADTAPQACTVSTKEAFVEKQRGISAFREALSQPNNAADLKREKYLEAKTHFEKAVQLFEEGRIGSQVSEDSENCPGGDPETLIYLNNTKSLTSEKSIITIAAVVPGGSDENRKVAAGILRGVAHAQNQINLDPRGIKDHMLQVLIARDDNSSKGTSDSDVASRVAQYLKDNDIPGDTSFQEESSYGVLGVVGHYTSSATLAAGKFYDNHLPAIAPTSTAVRTNVGTAEHSGQFGYIFDLSQWFFRVAPNDAVAAQNLVRYLPPAQNAFIVYNSESVYSMSLAEAFVVALEQDKNGSMIGKCDLSKENDCVDVPSQLATARTNALMLIPSDLTDLSQIVDIVNAFDEPQRQATTILGGDVMYDEEIIVQLKDKATGTLVGVAWHRDEVPARLQPPFIQLWGTRFVSWETATAHDSTQALVEGLRQARSFTRRSLYDALQQVEFQGLTGTVKFEPNSHDRVVDVNGERVVGVVVEVVNGSCSAEDSSNMLQFCLLD